MNSQDKPFEANDNLDESPQSSDSPKQEEENLGDLWVDEADPELSTEFISNDAANVNIDIIENTDAIVIKPDRQSPEKKLSDADFDNWDFRDVLYVDDSEASDIFSDDISSETVQPTQEATSSIDEGVSSESELELEAINDFELPAFATETIFDDSFIEENDQALEKINDSEELSWLEEPTLETSLDELDLDSSEELELSVETEATLETSLDELDLDSSEELELSVETETTLETSLDELDLDSSEELELSALEANHSDHSLPELDLDNSSLELGDLEDLEDDLESLTVEALEDLDSDSLDSLLDLDADNESLESLVLETDSDLSNLETALSVDAGLTDLDSLLEEEDQTTPTPVTTPSTPAPSSPTPAKAQAFEQTMRVSVKRLDDLNNLIGELVVKRNRLEDDQERLRRFLDNLLGHVQSLGEVGAKMHDVYERSLLEGALIASRQSRANSAVAAGGRNSGFGGHDQPEEEGLDALEMDRFTGFHLLSQEIIELIVRVREAASDIQFVVDETDKVAQTFRQVTSQLQDGMNASRMVTFGQTADRLPRAIRDISRKQKKQTKLNVEGKDVLIDKMIVEHLYNPMTHLVNNAISHGIETPEERRKVGKPEAGNINIRAFIQGNQTVITVTDDGAGIDPERVKQKAIEKNLVTWATAQHLSEQQVYELLFHPGFSTKDQADDFAGRGVGMDVVNTDLKKIRGSISTESQVGKGTTFTIRLPLVLSICKALTCVDKNNAIAFPIDGVEDTKEYLPSDIQTNANGVRCITWKNTLLPLRPLDGLLNYNRQIRRAGSYNTNQDSDDTISVVILRSLDNLLAVEVDEVRAEQEIVIKQIDGPIPKPPGIAGATVLGDGTIMPIGDVLELIEIAQGKRTIEIGFDIIDSQKGQKQIQAESITQEPMVLVVDDSITVRELLSMSFNKLGYRVEQARDGQEAWDKLRGGLVCDMIFSDIEMPRMNGLELLSNLHKDEKLRSIPVAMLTSRGADKHKKIANDLGAKAYLTKPYTEKDLMDVAQHLIEINRANQEAESATVSTAKVKNRQTEVEVSTAPLVLIIDDSVTVRELLSMSFKKAGYRVEQARDGQDAWEKLQDGLEADIAFCDIEMPRMNGLELLSQLQKDEKLSQLPIAMLTSRGAQKMRNIAASRGANGYFVKPYVEDELLKAAARMINGEMLIETSTEE